MLNRSIQLNLVKKNKDATADETVDARDLSIYLEAARMATIHCASIAIVGIGTYMTFDTVRKIAINRLSK